MASDEAPKWLDAENDQSHQEEIAPLFGTGTLSLRDESDEEDCAENTGAAKKASSTNYGSIESDEETGKPSIVTGISAGSSGSGRLKKVSRVVITETGRPESPRRNCLLAVFHFIEAYGVVTSICLLVTQVLPIVLVPLKEIGAMSLVLKIYVSLFCFLFVLVEWDAPIPFLRDATFLQRYISRGFLYSFLGLSCLEEAYSERVNDMVAHAKDQFHVSWFSLFMQISSWMMVGLGIIYMVLGVCCIKNLRDRMMQSYREQWEAYRDAMKEYKESNVR